MVFVKGFVPVTGGKIWYEMYGREKQATPVVVLHGGPGSSSYSLQGLKVLGEERPVVLYDQLGCGKSDRPDDESLWKLDRFVDELDQLIEGIRLGKVDLLGHSWGTTLAAAYYMKYPEKVNKIIFSSPCLSAPMWAADQDENRKQLPEDVQRVLTKGEETGETNTLAYKKATEVFNQHFVLRLDPKPAFLEKGKEYRNEKIYQKMWGPSEFYVTGNLKNMDFTKDLHTIAVPTLFLCGRYDEATPETTAFYSQLVPNSHYFVFEDSAHLAYLEEPDTYIEKISTFLHE